MLKYTRKKMQKFSNSFASEQEMRHNGHGKL